MNFMVVVNFENNGSLRDNVNGKLGLSMKAQTSDSKTVCAADNVLLTI